MTISAAVTTVLYDRHESGSIGFGSYSIIGITPKVYLYTRESPCYDLSEGAVDMTRNVIRCLVLLCFSVLFASGQTLTGIPPVVDPRNVYSESAAGKVSAATSG